MFSTRMEILCLIKCSLFISYSPTHKKRVASATLFLQTMYHFIYPILSPYHSASSPLRYSDESLLRVLVGERREAD